MSDTGIRDPSSRYGPESVRGRRSTYCSPTADTLRTSACRSAGIFGEVSSDNVASAPFSVSFDPGHLADLDTAVGHVAEAVEPTGRRQLQLHRQTADAEQRRHLHVGEEHHRDTDDRRDREDDQLISDETGQHQPPPPGVGATGAARRGGRRRRLGAVGPGEDLVDRVIGCDCGSHGAAGGGGTTGSSGSVTGGRCPAPRPAEAASLRSGAARHRSSSGRTCSSGSTDLPAPESVWRSRRPTGCRAAASSSAADR